MEIELELPLCTVHNNKILTHVTVKDPSGGAIANTLTTIENSGGNTYSGMHSLMLDCCLEFSNKEKEIVITDKQQIRAILKSTRYKSIEYAVIKSVIQLRDDDGIEGYYECPKCGNNVDCSKHYDEDTRELISDNRDFLSELELLKCKDPNETGFIHAFSQEIKIGQGKTPAEVVKSVGFDFITLGNCINAFNKTGTKDKARLQYQIYIEAITTINGKKVDVRWKDNFGMAMFNNASFKDIVSIFKKGRKYGLNLSQRKNCPKCSNRWFAIINALVFFRDALQDLQ